MKLLSLLCFILKSILVSSNQVDCYQRYGEYLSKNEQQTLRLNDEFHG